MKSKTNISIIILTIGIVIIVVVGLFINNFVITTPRELDLQPQVYSVEDTTSEEIVYIAYHLNTSGDNFASREVGLDLLVQNGNKGFKQTIDSCEDAGSGALDLRSLNLKLEDEDKTVFCDEKIYLVQLEEGKVVFYRYESNKSTRREVATSMPISMQAKRIIIVHDYKIYDKVNKILTLELETEKKIDSVSDPRYVYSSDSEYLYRIDIDLNNDGYNEALISNPKAINGKTGLMWNIFTNKGNGTYSFSEAEEYIITLSPGAIGYEVMPGDSTKSLITYMPSSSTNGVLVSYRIKDGKVIEKVLEIEPTGKDEFLYERLVKNAFYDKDSDLKIMEIPARID